MATADKAFLSGVEGGTDMTRATAVRYPEGDEARRGQLHRDKRQEDIHLPMYKA